MSEIISADRRLIKEVSIILVIKVALLLCLWWAFFSQPTHEAVDTERVATHITGPVTH